MDRRTRARELAMQSLYQLDVQGGGYLGELGTFLHENSDDEAVFEMADKWSRKTWENLSVCDGFIKEAAVKWDLSRLSQVDRSILRLSVYQLKFCPDIPGKVVINEAIELAKKYGAEQTPRFVNGVLDAIFRKLSTGEAAG
ncbi:MAG TPA: transcription antitermination factor NusB [Planctomycetes bacterium]|nr:transcription antitermination factor NusB [Planctomycetota bacterium]